MDKAILKTLAYADIFDYPMTLREIHKWLISKKANLRQAEKTLSQLSKKGKVKSKKEYYFLTRREEIVKRRLQNEKQSKIYFRKAKIIAQILKVISWIKLVGVSGGLAMENVSKKDDIDLFLITAKNRLWISRLLALGLLSLIGQRRKVGDLGQKVVGKLCINTLLEEDCLEQANKDIYLAHEVLQMRPLWFRDGIYSKYLEDNSWAFGFLPNWVDSYNLSLRGVKRRSNLKERLPRSLRSLAMTGLENLAKKFQLKIMQKPQGMERIEDGALYFHPKDVREKISSLYKQKLAGLDK